MYMHTLTENLIIACGKYKNKFHLVLTALHVSYISLCHPCSVDLHTYVGLWAPVPIFTSVILWPVASVHADLYGLSIIEALLVVQD